MRKLFRVILFALAAATSGVFMMPASVIAQNRAVERYRQEQRIPQLEQKQLQEQQQRAQQEQLLLERKEVKLQQQQVDLQKQQLELQQRQSHQPQDNTDVKTSGPTVNKYDASAQHQGETIVNPRTNNEPVQSIRNNEPVQRSRNNEASEPVQVIRNNEAKVNQHTERFVDPYTPYESKSDIGDAKVQSGSPVSGSSVSERPVRIYRNKDGSARITNY